MTSEKILEVARTYQEFFERNSIKKVDYPHDEILQSLNVGLEHCHGMIEKIVEFIHQGRREKAMRWVCFIQGYLWSQGIYTLTDFMNHNRPS